MARTPPQFMQGKPDPKAKNAKRKPVYAPDETPAQKRRRRKNKGKPPAFAGNGRPPFPPSR